MKPKLIIFNGAGASGKSTISKEFWKGTPRTSLIQLDNIKWLISDYKTNDFDLDLAREVGLKMTELYLSNNINVILEKAFCKEEYLLPFLNYAKKNNVKTFVYNLEAPWSIIKERIVSREQEMTIEKGKKLFDEYNQNKFEVNNTFDTSKLSIKEIISIINKDIQGKS